MRYSSFPSFTTNRLLLRQLLTDDEEFLIGLDTNADVMRYINDGPLTREKATQHVQAEIFLAEHSVSFGRWLVELRDNKIRLGWIELRKYRNRRFDDYESDDLQIAYEFFPAYWGQGYAVEAAEAVLSYGFDQLELERILVYTRPDNERSTHLIQRLSFEGVGFCYDSAKQKCKLYKLTRSQWNSLKNIEAGRER